MHPYFHHCHCIFFSEVDEWNIIISSSSGRKLKLDSVILWVFVYIFVDSFASVAWPIFKTSVLLGLNTSYQRLLSYLMHCHSAYTYGMMRIMFQKQIQRCFNICRLVFYLSIYLSVCLSIFLSVYLSALGTLEIDAIMKKVYVAA